MEPDKILIPKFKFQEKTFQNICAKVKKKKECKTTWKILEPKVCKVQSCNILIFLKKCTKKIKII